MTSAAELRDLFVVTADSHIQQSIVGLLTRTQSLRIRPVDVLEKVDTFVYPDHDGGCRARGVDFLQPAQRSYRHGLLVFDLDGSGAGTQSGAELERRLEDDLCRRGWEDRAAVIVIEPEIEAWVWSGSEHVAQTLGWSDAATLHDWLLGQGVLKHEHETKPTDPKRAMQMAMKQTRKKPSAAVFRKLAERSTWRGCTDRSFLKLVATLQRWFPEPVK